MYAYLTGARTDFPTPQWEAHSGDCGWTSYPGMHLIPEGSVLFHLVRNPLDVAWSYSNGC